MSLGARLATARSWLYVPGDRPDRFSKASESGADAVILDLEDAVATDRKGEARAAVRAWLGAGGAGTVRVNSPGSEWFEADLDALADQGCAIFLPKVESRAQIEQALSWRPAGCLVIPLIETPRGVLNLCEIATTQGVARMAFGDGDLGSSLGVPPGDHLPFQYVRSLLVLASAAAELAPPIDGVTTALGDLEKLREDTIHASRLGFGARACIHPRQVAVVNALFSPSEEEVVWARAVIEAADGASVVNGEMVDAPVVHRARRILDRLAEEQSLPQASNNKTTGSF